MRYFIRFNFGYFYAEFLVFGGYAQHLICSQKKIPKQARNDKTLKLDIRAIAKTEIFLQALYVPGGQSGAGQAEKIGYRIFCKVMA